jgi:pyruvate dehydrogenase E2 component (dihydrolipoamide acetyltransferase)
MQRSSKVIEWLVDSFLHTLFPMAIREVFMPALSSTMTEGKIVSWAKSPGDRVEKGETVLVVESDKADMDVESFAEGFLAILLFEAGSSVPVGHTIALIAETEAEIAEAKQRGATATPSATVTAAPASTPTTAPVAVIAAPPSQAGRLIASPRAKKLAKDMGVNLEQLKGTGPNGRVVAADVAGAAGKPLPASMASPSAPQVIPAAGVMAVQPTAAPPAGVPMAKLVPFNTLQNAVNRNMVASLAVPTFCTGYTITTDKLDILYKQLKPKGVTMSALLAKAVAMTLQKYPVINSSFTDAGMQYHGAINVSVAVAMPDGGLITPVLANADRMDIYSLSRAWKDLVDRARAKQLQPAEYSSGTFTISNLGMFGVDKFDAILPPGTGAILAIGAARPTVVATSDGAIAVRQQMQVNMTADHRIIYGADAAAFLQDLAKLIETDVNSLTM